MSSCQGKLEQNQDYYSGTLGSRDNQPRQFKIGELLYQNY